MDKNAEKNAIIPNIDQEAFRGLVERALYRLCKRVQSVSMLQYSGPGYSYQDYVVTIKASKDRKTCEVWRNRDGVMVFSTAEGRITGINYEYIFIDRHMRSKLGEGD
jgi:hypothetical protein